MRKFNMDALPEKLVIIDYCGTLSLEAPRFGRPENLVRALKESGLATLGISTPEAFWSDIVDPTWVEGSTTSIGYARVMANRIASLNLAPEAPMSEIDTAAARFVAMYLEASRIDPRWQPILSRLSRHTGAVTVVATDHYAEATGQIIGCLGLWDIPARGALKGEEPVLTTLSEEASRFFRIANSADLGAWKQDLRFWETLRSWLPGVAVRRILLIDDFGFNEAPGDGYGEQTKVIARRKKIVAHLGNIFQTGVEVEAFYLPVEDWRREAAGALLIEETAARIREFLER